MSNFNGRQTGYLETAARQVPGLGSLHRMTSLLLAERVPDSGRVLVIGAGGGLELNALAGDHEGWSFDGVDPSSDMLTLAGETSAAHAARIRLHHGDITVAPPGPFDAAVCLLVFHHISIETRIQTLDGIRKRLKPGSPFVLAHVSFPQTEPQRSIWIDRHIAYGAQPGTDPERLEAGRVAMKERLFTLSPETEEDLLAKAGFKGITQFYAAFSFRGWVSYA